VSALARKRVVVVGGSSGIGLAAAEAARAAGADVVPVSRRTEPALDVTDAASVTSFFESVGSLDHLVFTPTARASGPIAEVDLEAARGAFEAKFFGALLCVRHAMPRLAAEGSITLLSGAAAWTPMRGGAITASVNGAIAALVRTLAVELAPVRVNAVSPGIIDTPTWSGLPDEQRTAMFDRLAAALPVGRVGTAADVGEAIVFLMSSGFTTGTVLHVEGGHDLAAP
jgi:NAD(P)-dependent dehydrogenase (short-subunit alcohol dehydrogenase family)